MPGGLYYADSSVNSLSIKQFSPTEKVDDFTELKFGELKNNTNNSIPNALQNKTNDFPESWKPPGNIQTKINVCSLFDTVHDFGSSSCSDDKIRKKARDDNTTLVMNSMIFTILGKYNFNDFGSPVNVNTFYQKHGRLNGSSFMWGLFKSNLNNNEVENSILLDAIHNTNGSLEFITNTDKELSQKLDQIYGKILEFYDKFKDNEKIHLIIDTNKTLFTKKDKSIALKKFVYLLTQEVINDPAPKKIPSQCSPFDKGNYYIEKSRQSRTYQKSGQIKISFKNMENKVNKSKLILTTKCQINDDASFQIEINKKNPNKIPVVKKAYRELVLSKKYCIKNHPTQDNPMFKIYKDYMNLNEGEASDCNKNIEIIKTLFSKKRFGDQMQAEGTDYINKTGITFLKIKENGVDIGDEVRVNNAVLVTGDRMLFAYAILRNIPCIFDYGNKANKTIILFKPRVPVAVPAQAGGQYGGAAPAASEKNITEIKKQNKFTKAISDKMRELGKGFKGLDDNNTSDPHEFLKCLMYTLQLYLPGRHHQDDCNNLYDTIYELFLLSNKNIDIVGNKCISRSDVTEESAYKIHMNTLIQNILNSDGRLITNTEISDFLKTREELLPLTEPIQSVDIDFNGNININGKKRKDYHVKGTPCVETEKNFTTNFHKVITYYQNIESIYENLDILDENLEDLDAFNSDNGLSGGSLSDTNTFLKSKSELEQLLLIYELSLIQDAEELTNSYTAHYLQNSNTPFYIVDDLCLHVFIEELMKILDESKQSINLHKLEATLRMLAMENNEAIQIVDRIDEIRDLLQRPYNPENKNKYILSEDEQDIILKAIDNVNDTIDKHNIHIYSKYGVELMNYSFANKLTELSLSSLITTLNNTNNFNISQTENISTSIKESNLKNVTTEPYKSKAIKYNLGIKAFGRKTKKSRKDKSNQTKVSKKREKMCLCPCSKDIKAYGKKSKSKVIKMIIKKANKKGRKLTQREIASLLSKKSKTKSKLD